MKGGLYIEKQKGLNMVKNVSNYFWNILGALSQLLNTTIGGHQNETICARLHLHREKPIIDVLRKISNKIFFFQQDHCKWSHTQGIRLSRSLLRAASSVSHIPCETARQIPRRFRSQEN